MNEMTILTLGQVAKKLGCKTWQVARLFERGILPDPPRAGILRVVPIADLPVVKAALLQAGYLAHEREAVPA